MKGAPPLISEVSRPWWEALRNERIEVQQCDACQSWVFYPRPFCPMCSGRTLTWKPVGSTATLYTWSVAEIPVASVFSHWVRPILAVVELSVGVHVPTRLVDVVPEVVAIGMQLVPVFDHETYEGRTILLFRPAAE